VGEKPFDLGTLEQGEIIGELSYILEGKASCSVIAKEDDTQVIHIDKMYLKLLFHSYPILASKFFKNLCVTIGLRISTREKENQFTYRKENTILNKEFLALQGSKRKKKKSKSIKVYSKERGKITENFYDESL